SPPATTARRLVRRAVRQLGGSAKTVNVTALKRDVATIDTLPVSGPTVITFVVVPVESVVPLVAWSGPLEVAHVTATPLIGFPKRSVARAVRVSGTPTSAAAPLP